MDILPLLALFTVIVQPFAVPTKLVVRFSIWMIPIALTLGKACGLWEQGLAGRGGQTNGSIALEEMACVEPILHSRCMY